MCRFSMSIRLRVILGFETPASSQTAQICCPTVGQTRAMLKNTFTAGR
jgi:hypothetical protein